MTVRVAVKDEVNIVWEEDISNLDYVREIVVTTHRRRGNPGRFQLDGRRVGYAELRADAPNCGAPGYFDRRVFFLKSHDRDSASDHYAHGAPAEAVDPRTVAPGLPGELTDRAWNGK